MWPVCLNLVCQALIADYQHKQELGTPDEVPASTAAGASGSGGSFDDSTHHHPQHHPRRQPLPMPAIQLNHLISLVPDGSAQPTLSPTSAAAITKPKSPTPVIATDQGGAAGTLGNWAQVLFILVSLIFQAINLTDPIETQTQLASLKAPWNTKKSGATTWETCAVW